MVGELGAEVLVGQGGDFAAARGAFEEAFFDEVGFVDFFHGAGVLAQGGGDGAEAYGAAVEFAYDGV